MLKHYFKIGFRNLGKQKGLTFINVFGLSVGLACFILFLLFAVNEFSFDRFHSNRQNIFRVYLHRDAIRGMDASESGYLPTPLGPALKQDFPEVQNFVRLKDAWEGSFVRANNKVTRIKVAFADADFFKVFSFPPIYGDAADPLRDPNSIVITKAVAQQLFGEVNAVGKVAEIKIDDKFEPFTIAAVTNNVPPNSTIVYEILASFSYYENTPDGKRGADNWHRSGLQTFVQLRPGSSLANATDQLRKFRGKYYADDEAEIKRAKLWTAHGSPIWYGLQPLQQIHTNPQIASGGVDPVNPKNIWIVLAIALGVLLIACINFTTLAIGRSAGRAKEVGVRKVIGSGKKQLLVQFLAEALLLTFLSAAIALVLVGLLLPSFNQLSGRDLTFSLARYPELWWMLAGLVVLVGLMAGSYPAIVLARFRPIEVLKKKIRVGGSNFFTRSLVTVQFVLSIGLIISTLVITQQLNFMKERNPGFNKENVVMVDAEGTDTRRVFPLFKQALTNQPSIAQVASAELGLGEGTGWSRSSFDYNGKHKDVYEYFVDDEYIRLMGMQLIAGRNFDRTITSDSVTSVVINESMMRDFGWTVNNAVGQQLKGYSDNFTPVVIGVVKDFNFRPFSEKIEPQMFQMFHDYAPYRYFVKIRPGEPSTALHAIQTAWTASVPDLPLKYDFLDDSLNRFYKSESRWSNIVGWAGGISIFLACLGLFGLAALAAVNRTREIGIRKVLGATVSGIVRLLSRDFLKLVLIALVIATPLAWYFMHRWLQDFAYRISIGPWVFVVAGCSALIVAFVTIGTQALRAGIANPVKSLRSE